jgi:hypothetical protein
MYHNNDGINFGINQAELLLKKKRKIRKLKIFGNRKNVYAIDGFRFYEFSDAFKLKNKNFTRY